MFCSSVFTIDGYEITDLQFCVLLHFKSLDIILGLPALNQLDVLIHPSLNTFTMGGITIKCNRESRRISWMIVDSNKIDQIIVKRARIRRILVMMYFLYLFTFLRIWHPLRANFESSSINTSKHSSRSSKM